MESCYVGILVIIIYGNIAIKYLRTRKKEKERIRTERHHHLWVQQQDFIVAI